MKTRYLVLMGFIAWALGASWLGLHPARAAPQALTIRHYSFETAGGYTTHHPPGVYHPEFSLNSDVFGRNNKDANWAASWGAFSGNWFFGWRDAEGRDPGTNQPFSFYSDEIELRGYRSVQVSLYWRAAGDFEAVDPDLLRAYLVLDGSPQPYFFEASQEDLTGSLNWAYVSTDVPQTAQRLRLVIEGLSNAGNELIAVDEIQIRGEPVTGHTIQLDGDLGDWSALHERIGLSGNLAYYLTWDAEYLYVGLSDAGAGAGNKYNVAIDIDPHNKGSANQGASAVYLGASWPAAGAFGTKPDYVIQSYQGGSAAAQAQAGGWQNWNPALSTVARGCDQRCAEWRFSKSELGLTGAQSAVGVFIWAGYTAASDQIYASWPPENRQDNGVFYAYTYVPDTLPDRIPAQSVQRRGAELLTISQDGNHVFLNGWVKLLEMQTQGSACEVLVSLAANGPVTGGPADFERLVELTRGPGCSAASGKFQIFYEDTELGTGDQEQTLRLYHWGSWLEAGGSGYWRDPDANFVERQGFELPDAGSPAYYTLGSSAPTALTLAHFSGRSAALPWGALCWVGVILAGWLGWRHQTRKDAV